MDLSVVIPCYNEEESLPEMLRRVQAACRAAPIGDYEIVLIDDGSRDATWQLIQDAAQQEGSHVVGVGLARNHGHQLALTAGLNVCKGEKIFILDADLQDPPELLTPMLAVLNEGADVVYGQRSVRKGETAMKKLTASLFYRFLNQMTEVPIPVDTGDFRLMRRQVLDVLNSMPESHRFIRGMVSWVGFKQVAFPYARDERFAGETKYPFRKMLKLAVDAVTGFSVKPLAIASYFGFIFGSLGLLMMIYAVISWFANDTIRGWTSLISIVLILGSVQLIVLGVIGEYLGRLYIENKRRPMFIIREVVRGGAAVPLAAADAGEDLNVARLTR